VRRLAGAIAALTIAGGTAALTAEPSRAATPSCGPSCIDIFNKNFGSYFNPQFVVDTFRQKQAVGQPVILFREANSDPAQDFTLTFEGQVSNFFNAGLVSAAFALHYGCEPGLRFTGGTGGTITCTSVNPLTGQRVTFPDLYAFEIEYAPYGVESGLCVGATSAAPGSKVTLQPCGAAAGTVWAADTLDSCPANPLYSLEVQAINGLDTNFSHPSVLTYPAGSFPTDKPRPQLFLSSLAGFSQTGGTAGPPNTLTCGGLAVTGPDNNQLWGAVQGVLP
jgi:hypothetical protein